MTRLLFAALAVPLLAVVPLAGQAASPMPRPVATANPAITFVDGWWEQEHREQDAPDRYWKLPPQQLQRYNRLQAEHDRREAQRRRIDDDNRRAEEEQHRILGFQINIH